MKFFVDHQLPPALAGWLRAKGFEAVAARDAGFREADDAEIWAYAAEAGFVIVTKDQDFVSLAIREGPTVLWVRIGNVLNRVLLARFEAAWPEVLRHFESDRRVIELR